MSRPRIAIANGMIRLGRFLQSMAISVMRPDDLTEFSRRSYADNSQVDDWGRREFIDLGLDAAEKSFLSRLPCPSGKLLLLGVGGGREARVLARHGYDVTGVDFIPAMVERARENAREQGLDMAGVVQDLSRLDLPADTFSVAWFSPRMYSLVPTRTAAYCPLATDRHRASARRLRLLPVPLGSIQSSFIARSPLPARPGWHHYSEHMFACQVEIEGFSKSVLIIVPTCAGAFDLNPPCDTIVAVIKLRY